MVCLIRNLDFDVFGDLIWKLTIGKNSSCIIVKKYHIKAKQYIIIMNSTGETEDYQIFTKSGFANLNKTTVNTEKVYRRFRYTVMV